MPPAVAIAGATVVGAGASAVGASKNAKAIKKSTNAQVQAEKESLAAQQQSARESLAVQTAAANQASKYQADAFNSSGQLQTGIYNNNVGMLNPFTQTGYASMNQINSLLGLPQQAAYTPQNVNFTPVSVEPIALPQSVQNALAPTPAPGSPNAPAQGLPSSSSMWLTQPTGNGFVDGSLTNIQF